MTATPNTKFDRILDLEAAVRISAAVRTFRGAGLSDFVAGQQDASHDADKARLYQAISDLTADEMAEFGEYRKAVQS